MVWEYLFGSRPLPELQFARRNGHFTHAAHCRPRAPHPLAGDAPDGNGDLQPTTLDTAALIYLIDAAGYGPPVYRVLDAAARAWLDSKDALPLLRLVAEENTASVDHPVDFSYGLYSAVTCTDYPLLYDLTASDRSATTNTQMRCKTRAITVPIYLRRLPSMEASIRRCTLPRSIPVCRGRARRRTWRPARPELVATQRAFSRGAHAHSLRRPRFHHVGDRCQRDERTVSERGSRGGTEFGHVVADGDFVGCTLGLVQRFVRNLAPGNTDCVREVRRVGMVPKFALTAASWRRSPRWPATRQRTHSYASQPRASRRSAT